MTKYLTKTAKDSGAVVKASEKDMVDLHETITCTLKYQRKDR